MRSLLTERYADKIKGVLSCFDRIAIQGTLPNIGHAHGMTAYLCSQHIQIFDYTQFAGRHLNKISKIIVENERFHRGVNFFDDDDARLFEIIARSEFNISGFKNKNLRRFLQDKTCEQVSRILKRLRMNGLIMQIRSMYKCYLTKLGRRVLASGVKLRELTLISALASPLAAENA